MEVKILFYFIDVLFSHLNNELCPSQECQPIWTSCMLALFRVKILQQISDSCKFLIKLMGEIFSAVAFDVVDKPFLCYICIF